MVSRVLRVCLMLLFAVALTACGGSGGGSEGGVAAEGSGGTSPAAQPVLRGNLQVNALLHAVTPRNILGRVAPPFFLQAVLEGVPGQTVVVDAEVDQANPALVVVRIEAVPVGQYRLRVVSSNIYRQTVGFAELDIVVEPGDQVRSVTLQPGSGAGVEENGSSVVLGPPLLTAHSIYNLDDQASPGSVAAGDFDEDGHQDAACFVSGVGVVIFLGDGQGFFQRSATLATSGVAERLLVGDVNGDDNLDLVANVGNQLRTYRGGGDGTFSAVTSVVQLPAGVLPVYLARIDGDTMSDLVATGPDGLVYTFLGMSAGTFGPPISTDARDAGWVTRGAVSGDFDGDGIVDLFLLQTVTGTFSDRQILLRAQTSGTFVQTQTLSLGGQFSVPESGAAGDFDGDGRLDLAVHRDVRGAMVAYNSNSGFLQNVFVPLTALRFLQAGDFDNDGRADLFASGVTYSAVARSLGGQQFAAPQLYYGANPFFTATGRFDADMGTDVIGTQAGGLILFGTRPLMRELSPPRHFDSDLFIRDMAVGDINRDGRDDLALAGDAPTQVLIAAADGSLGSSEFFETSPGERSRSVRLVDLNNDLNLELLTDRLFYLGNGNRFSETGSSSSATPESRALTLAHFDADGNIDMAYSQGTSVVIGGGDGDGTFSPGSVLAAGGPNGVTVLDGLFDAGGNRDLAWLTGSGKAFLALGRGDLTFEAPVLLHDVSPGFARALGRGDFNADGIDDICLAVGFAGNEPDRVRVFINDGTGNFAAPVEYAIGKVAQALLVEDIDGDTIPDIVTAHQTSGDISVLKGLGGGNFSQARSFATGILARHLRSGDLNNDGLLDLVVSGDRFGSNGGRLAVLFGRN